MSGQPEPSESQKQAYLANLRQQMNQQFVQDLMHKITDGCYTKCASNSGDGLSGSEKTCMRDCMARYMDTMGVVNKVLSSQQH